MRLLKFWFPVFLYSAIIFAVSAVPNLRPPVERPGLDKVCHVIEYIVFGCLLARALTNSRGQLSPPAVIWIVVILSLLYGLSDEWHQSFVRGRTADLWDALADTIGGALGGFIYPRLSKFRQQDRKIS